MSRLPSLAAFLAALAMLTLSAAAWARNPWPVNPEFSAHRINLVGWHSNAGNPANASDSVAFLAKFWIRTLDIAYNPIAGMPVVIDFSGCPDIRIAATQPYHQLTVGCATATVQAYTTMNGAATFVVVGGLANRGDHLLGCAKVYADSYLMGSLGVGTYDQNDAGGMTLADVAFFWSDLGSGTVHDRSDLDGNGALTLADMAYAWEALGHAFDRSGAALCP